MRALKIISQTRPILRNWPAEAAGRKNMLLLIQLRWIAAAGQLFTILIVHYGMGIRLPLLVMMIVPVAATGLNLGSLAVLRRRQTVANAELFLALLFDVVALTIQLYLSGGATNPFIYLYLLQVVLGAILLDTLSAWAIVFATSVFAAILAKFYWPLVLPSALAESLFEMHIIGAWICFALIAVLLVVFVTRINRNLQARDARLADMRQRAAEEDHIVRMGLLASGAAHELGTPLSSLAVILNDWKRMPALAAQPGIIGEIEEMQVAVQRCKTILSGILLSSGEARGEAPTIISIRIFLDYIVKEWSVAHAGVEVDYDNSADAGLEIVADPVLKQVIYNVLDNASEASPDWISLSVDQQGNFLRLVVRDDGPGFASGMLENLGKPYQSSKGKQGGGLGLFLVLNVMRKLGGEVTAENGVMGGAIVTLLFPLDTLGVRRGDGDVR
ncbi:MAG: ATP-binding protein [Sphingobium phenoxybenzoativorans]